ncbi:sensor histidine kinase [Candidatus Woesebacteria bacterium]|nr:MAG: sensor histidine kinase [Candidatus Woesebacteria bacterium]
MKIRTKISLAFLLTAVILTGVTTPVSYFINKNNLERSIFAHLITTAKSRASYVQYFLDTQKGQFRIIQGSEVARGALENKREESRIHLKERLTRILETNKEYYELFVLGTDGKVFVTTNPKEKEGEDFSSNELFIKGKSELFLKGHFYEEEFDRYAMAISGPILSTENELLGVVIARINPESLNDIALDRTGLGETGEVYLVNREGYMITPSRFKEDVFFKEKINTVAAEHCFEDYTPKKEYEEHVDEGVYLDYRDIKVLNSHQIISETNWCLLAEIDEKEVLAPLVTQRKVALAILSVVPFLAFLAGYFITKIVTKKADILLEGVENIGKGNLDYRIEVKTRDEAGILAEAFNKMATDLKKSMISIDAVTKEKNKIDAILQSLHDGVFVIDNNFNVILYNEAATVISGFSFHEIIGRKFFEILKFVHEKDGKTDDNFIKDTIRKGKVHKTESATLLIGKDGKRIDVGSSAAPLEDKQGRITGCVVVFRDITKEKETSRMKDEFINIAAHDLRTPATAIKGYLSMLMEGDAGEFSEEASDMLKNAYEGNERLINLIDDFLTVSRVEKGKIEIVPKKTDLTKLVETSIKELKGQAKEKGLTLEYQKAKLPPVYADEERTIELLNNLIGNAIKFTDKGGVTVYHETDGKEIVTNIVDTGPGISKEMKMFLFQKYRRGGGRSNVTGLGLGLYISRLIIEGSGGRIWARSEEGKGATFSFSLRIVK